MTVFNSAVFDSEHEYVTYMIANHSKEILELRNFARWTIEEESTRSLHYQGGCWTTQDEWFDVNRPNKPIFSKTVDEGYAICYHCASSALPNKDAFVRGRQVADRFCPKHPALVLPLNEVCDECG